MALEDLLDRHDLPEDARELIREALAAAKRSEEALRLTRLTIDRSADPVFWMSPDARLVYANEAACRSLDRSPEDLLSMTAYDVDPALSPTAWQDRWSQLKEHGSLRLEAQLRRKDGRVFPVELTENLVEFEGEAYSCVVARDISVRRRVEESRSVLLNISEAAFRTGTLEELLYVVHREVGRLMDATNFDVALYDEETGGYAYPYCRDEHDEPTFSAEEMAHSLTEHVRSTGEPLLATDADSRELEQGTSVRLVGTPCAVWMGAPLRTSKGVIGVIALQSYTDPHAFAQQELELLSFVSGHIGTLVDRKRADQALRESEQRYRQLFETMAQGVVYQSRDGKITSANPAAQRILGMTLDQMQGRTSMDPRWKAIKEDGSPFPGDTHPAMLALRTGKDVRNVVMGVFHPERGEHRWISVDAVPQFRPGESSPYQVYATFDDITERERAEGALRDSEERFRTLSAASFEGLGISEGGVVRVANEQLARMLGYGSEEIIGRSVRDFVAPESQDLVARHIQSGHEAPYEHLAIRKDGSVFPVEARGGTLRYGGRPARVTAVRDITQRKHAEEQRRDLETQVQHAQKLESLGILAGGVAHDFNNLLVGILGHSSLALGKLAPENPARRNVEGAVRAAERAADLARQMLAYSGHGHFVVEAVDLSALVRENVHLLTAGIAKGAELRTDLSEDQPHVKADVGQIQQVIMNLVINAAEALREGAGTVTITTGTEVLSEGEKRYSRYTAAHLEPGRYAFLEVRDDGCGMDEEALSKLFDPFFTTKFVGRGLGLSAVLGIIRGHRGGIDVQSHPGKGTTFRLVFPLTEDAPASKEAAGSQGPVGGTVLVIDDEEMVREMASEMLTPGGLEVVTANGGAAGLALYEQRRSDIALVLLDFSMPGMSGEETFKELRRLDPDVPIVLSSGYGQEEVTRRFEGLGLAGFVQKPYKPDALLSEIRRCLDSEGV